MPSHYEARLLRAGGTFAPARRAFESPIAIACLRLLCSPRFKCFISVSTSFFAFGPYFAPEVVRFFAAVVERFFEAVVVRFFVLLELADFVFARVGGREVAREAPRLRDEVEADFFFAELREAALVREPFAEAFFAFARGDFFAFRDVVPFAGILFPLDAR